MPFSGFHPVPDDAESTAPSGTAAPSSVPSSSSTSVPSSSSSSSASTSSTSASSSSSSSSSSSGSDSQQSTALVQQFEAAIDAARLVSTKVSDYDQVSNSTVQELHVLAAENARLADAMLAMTAGQIARRSAPSLGSGGMAQQSGHRTPVDMARSLGKITKQEAAKAVRQGTLIHTTQTIDTADETGIPAVDSDTGEEVVNEEPWLASVGRALTEGLSVDAADSIRRGLGIPSEDVTIDMLAAAAEELCKNAALMGPDQLFQRARRLRDEIDAAGIGLREHERHQRRSLTFVTQRDGMTRVVWLMDPETAATVGECYDRATSPRRGGPRSANKATSEHAETIRKDERSTEQIASDVFAQLLQLGVAADPSMVLGTGTPSVRIVTTRRPGATPGSPDEFGPGMIEGQQDLVSPETVQRLVCTGATITVTVDEEGHPIDVGSEQRLFTRKQRIGFAVRDGGCTFPDDPEGETGCDRPPSWTEAHHVAQWKRDGGKTNVRNGTLLCKSHHLLLHNEGWEIEVDGGVFWLIPPVSVDPQQTKRRMRTRRNLFPPEAGGHASAGAAPESSPDPAPPHDHGPVSEPDTPPQPSTPPTPTPPVPSTSTTAPPSASDVAGESTQTPGMTTNGVSYWIVPRKKPSAD